MGALDFVDIVRDRAEQFGALARTTPHELRLPHLRRWTVHDVVAHLTGDHAWALDILSTRRPPRRGLAKDRRRGDALCDRYDEVTTALVAALADAAREPDAPCPNFAEGTGGRAGWWPRHQAHEAVVHLWDLEAATGDHTPLDPLLSIDGITELFEVYTNRYDGQRLTRPLVLRCPDHGVAWRAEPATPAGRVHVTPTDPSGTADLDAPPDALLLALWHRLPADDARLVTHGDPTAVRAFLRGPLTA